MRSFTYLIAVIEVPSTGCTRMSGQVPEHRGFPSPDVLEVQSADYGCTYLGPARHLAWIGEYLVKSEFLLNV